MNEIDKLMMELIDKYGDIGVVSEVISKYMNYNKNHLEVDESTIWLIANITKESLKTNHYVLKYEIKNINVDVIKSLIKKLKDIDLVVDNCFFKLIDIYQDRKFIKELFEKIYEIKITNNYFLRINEYEEIILKEVASDKMFFNNNSFDNYRYYIDNFYANEEYSIEKIKRILIYEDSGYNRESDINLNALLLPTYKEHGSKGLHVALFNFLTENNPIYFTTEDQNRKRIIGVGKNYILRAIVEEYVQLNIDDYISNLILISYNNNILYTVLNAVLRDSKFISDLVENYIEYVYVRRVEYIESSLYLMQQLDLYFDNLEIAE